MKKSAYEVLMTINVPEEFIAYAEEHLEEICAYMEEHWEEMHPEVPRDQWDIYCEVKEEVESRAEEDLRKRWNIKDNNWPLGSCHMIWARMKEIFKEEYNIDWKAPAECEPDVYED